MLPKSRCSKQFSASPRGQLPANWTGPIANGSETGWFSKRVVLADVSPERKLAAIRVGS